MKTETFSSAEILGSTNLSYPCDVYHHVEFNFVLENKDIPKIAEFLKNNKNITHITFSQGTKFEPEAKAYAVLVEILSHKKNLLSVKGIDFGILETSKLNKALKNNKGSAFDCLMKLIDSPTLSTEEKYEVIKRQPAICCLLDQTNHARIANKESIKTKINSIFQEQYVKGQLESDAAVKSAIEQVEFNQNNKFTSRLACEVGQYDSNNLILTATIPANIAAVAIMGSLMATSILTSTVAVFILGALITIAVTQSVLAHEVNATYEQKSVQSLDYGMVRG